jgi:selT/selW/selH-like putative selenoprotein
MAVTKERFDQGMSYEAYKAQMERNQDRFATTEATVVLDAGDLAYFTHLPETLHVLVLAEDWCGDVIANLPVLGRLAQACGKLNLRIFLRDQNLDLMEQYLHQGKFRAIPTFVFFDQSFNELGVWIERPARLRAMQQQMRLELFANDPLLAPYSPDTPMGQLPDEARERVREASNRFREEHREFSDREVVRELRALLEHGIAQSSEHVVQMPAPWQNPRSRNGEQANGEQANGEQASGAGGIKVSITYCAECGYEPQTLALTSALMQSFGHQLASIEIIPWQDGAFDVVVNGELVHSMVRDGGFPEAESVIGAVRERIG